MLRGNGYLRDVVREWLVHVLLHHKLLIAHYMIEQIHTGLLEETVHDYALVTAGIHAT
jgi:hypothetical protein